jgi:ketopantoate reductase
MSPASRNSKTFHVVWGAGALGTLLAWDLERSAAQEFLLIGRSPTSTVPHIQYDGGIQPFDAARTRYYPFNSRGLLSQLSGAAAIVFYFCVPPQETDAAITAVQSRLRSLKPKRILFVFCQNGLVAPHQWLALTHTFHPDVAVGIVRALVYVGAERIREQENTTIFHRGGNRVRYETILGEAPTELFPPKTSLFNWTPEENIRSTELTKVFVNILLFVASRDQNLKNGEILESLPPDHLEAIAHAFAGVVATSQILPELLVSAFRETTSATAANINSVSLAWRNGDKSIWRYFRQTMTALMECSPNALAATELARLLETMPSWHEGV